MQIGARLLTAFVAVILVMMFGTAVCVAVLDYKVTRDAAIDKVTRAIARIAKDPNSDLNKLCAANEELARAIFSDTSITTPFFKDDKTALGAMVSIVGSLVTITLLYLWIPRFGYEGAAWATLACYVFMATASYLLGRKFFPVPYNLWKLFFYIAVCVAVWFIAISVNYPRGDLKFVYQFALLAVAIFVLLFSERNNLKNILKRL